MLNSAITGKFNFDWIKMFGFTNFVLFAVFVIASSEKCVDNPQVPLQWLLKGNLTGNSFPFAILNGVTSQTVTVQTSWTNTTINIAAGLILYNIYWIDVPDEIQVSPVRITLVRGDYTCHFETKIYKFTPIPSFSVNTVTMLYSSLNDLSKNTLLAEFAFAGGVGGDLSVKFDVSWKEGDCTSLTQAKIRNWKDVSNLFVDSVAMQTFPYQQGFQNRSPCPDGGRLMTIKVEYSSGLQKDFTFVDYTSDCDTQKTATKTPEIFNVLDKLGAIICTTMGKTTENCLISHDSTRLYLLDSKCMLPNSAEEDAKKAFLGIFGSGIVILGIVSICLAMCCIVIWRRKRKTAHKVSSHPLESDDEIFEPGTGGGNFVLGDDELNEEEMEAKLLNN
jgi:hypothetical protein